jgi:hypothetical protein
MALGREQGVIEMTQHSVDIHKKIRQYRPPAFADFMDTIYARMLETERQSLPDETFQYVNALLAYALDHFPEFGEAIAEMVAGVYSQSPSGERFVLDAKHSNDITSSILFLDADGQLVSVKNPRLVREGETRDDIGVLVMNNYQSYSVLTGPMEGERFDRYSRPLPATPVYRPGVVLGTKAALLPLAGRAGAQQDSECPGDFRVFLCHASEDKKAVRTLHSRLQKSGFRPWLDEEDILPGQDWNAEITKAVRATHVVLVCLSQRSERPGYVQKEIVRALEMADEQPEGTIFLIPVRLEDCEVPERVRRWQWVDLFEEGGYTKLEVALKLAARRAST